MFVFGECHDPASVFSLVEEKTGSDTLARFDDELQPVFRDDGLVDRIALAALVVSTGVIVRRVVDPGGVPEDLAEDLILRFVKGEEG